MAGVLAFMSGVEGASHFDQCIACGVRHVLFSYYQLLRRGKELVKLRHEANPDVKIMVDSGAHTFITDPSKFKKWSRQDFEDYIKGYVAWIRQNRKHLFAVVEADIEYCLHVLFSGREGSKLGLAIVEQWQKNYFQPLEKEGIQVIYCWHVERKLEGWEEMCSKFAYVGLPGEMSSQPDFNKYLTIARRYCTKMHGFGAAKQIDYRDVSWYTIDATSWKGAEMYGVLMDWDERRQIFTYEDDKSKRINYRQKFIELGFDADGIIRDSNYKELTRYTLYSLGRMEAFYAERYKKRMAYHEVRLLHPDAVSRWSPRQVWPVWKKMRPEHLFQQHAKETDWKQIRFYLAAIAAVQYKCDKWFITYPAARDFLGAYFSAAMDTLMTEPVIFQKELAIYLAPPVPPALERALPEHWLPQNNPPKLRDEQDWKLEELEWDRNDLVSQALLSGKGSD